MNVLEVNNLKKSFGQHEVLKGVTFHAKKGRALGFIGINGAGKTTTMKIITGLMHSDNGDIFITGEKTNKGPNRKNVSIGYLPDVPAFYPYLTAREYLKLCGEIMDQKPAEILRQSEELLELVGLKEIKKRIGTFSRGMKQRLGMAQALMGNPGLLLCDEPTSALDPRGRREVLELISRIKERTTVIFSTHVLTDVEQVCDDVAILHDGGILYCGKLAELKKKHGSASLELEFSSPAEAKDFQTSISAALGDTDLILEARKLSISVIPEKQEKVEAHIWSVLRSKEVILKSYAVQQPTLEQVFLEVTK